MEDNMTRNVMENQNHWRNSVWAAIVGFGLLLSACGTSPVRNDCSEAPQLLETTAPWASSCDQATSRHDPFWEMESRHGSPNG
jgi:hypothetical protein